MPQSQTSKHQPRTHTHTNNLSKYISRRRATTSGALFYSPLRASLSLLALFGVCVFFLLPCIFAIAPTPNKWVLCVCASALHEDIHVYLLTIYIRYLFVVALFFLFFCSVYVVGAVFRFVLFIPPPRMKLKGGPVRVHFCKLGYVYMFGLSTKTINRNLCVVVVVLALFCLLFFLSRKFSFAVVFSVQQKKCVVLWVHCAHTHTSAFKIQSLHSFSNFSVSSSLPPIPFESLVLSSNRL